MKKSLEKLKQEFIKEKIEFNIHDSYLPFGPLRHISRIAKEKNTPIIKALKLTIITKATISNFGAYYSIYNLAQYLNN